MKKSVIVFIFFLSLLVVAETSFATVLSIYNCQTTETTDSCCKKESSHCKTKQTQKEKKHSCNNSGDCAMVCCASFYYLSQSPLKINEVLFQNGNKELIY